MPQHWSKEESSFSKVVFSNPLSSRCVQSIELIWNRDDSMGRRGAVNIICNIKDITEDAKSAELSTQLIRRGFPQRGIKSLSSGDIEATNHELLTRFLLAIIEAEGIKRTEFEDIFDALQIWEEDIEDMYPATPSFRAAADLKTLKGAHPIQASASSQQLKTYGVFNTQPQHLVEAPLRDNHLFVQSS